MTEAQKLAHPDVPGARVRAALIQKGIDAERQRLLAYLVEKGILREAMFYPGWVARKVDTPTDDVWPIIDLPADLNDWQPKGKENE